MRSQRAVTSSAQAVVSVAQAAGVPLTVRNPLYRRAGTLGTSGTGLGADWGKNSLFPEPQAPGYRWQLRGHGGSPGVREGAQVSLLVSVEVCAVWGEGGGGWKGKPTGSAASGAGPGQGGARATPASVARPAAPALSRPKSIPAGWLGAWGPGQRACAGREGGCTAGGQGRQRDLRWHSALRPGHPAAAGGRAAAAAPGHLRGEPGERPSPLPALGLGLCFLRPQRVHLLEGWQGGGGHVSPEGPVPVRGALSCHPAGWGLEVPRAAGCIGQSRPLCP